MPEQSGSFSGASFAENMGTIETRPACLSQKGPYVFPESITTPALITGTYDSITADIDGLL
jgi:hypothetical protein